MLVLAVDQKNTRDDGQTSVLGSTATLATTPEEAEQLALASSLGELRLLVRTPLDKGTVNYKPVTMGELGRQKHPKGSDPTNPDDPTTTDPGATATLPTLPTVDKTPAPVKSPELPEDKDPKTHTLKIISGDTTTKHIFIWDNKAGGWQGDDSKKPDAPKPEDA